MPYLNVGEVASAIETATLMYPTLCTRIQLPNVSCEGRTSHAIRVRGGPRVNRHGILLLGGQHAREWGSSDILISFIERLLQAYSAGTGLAFGPKVYTAGNVKKVVENIDLFAIPELKPDGKHFSQVTTPMWRTNRCPIAGSAAIGTDLNRNYDFLWDFRNTLAPAAFPGLVVSDTPGVETFHGTAPFSEPETRNVKFVLDSFPQIRLLLDVHSYSQLLMYPWGDDDDQSADPTMNFRNPAWNASRGVRNDAYGEYVHATDPQRWIAYCNEMNAALTAVRGRVYSVGQSFSLLYPTTGTSFCYAFSRHLVDSMKGKIDGLIIEWGLTFQPNYATEMVEIIKEVSSALLQLCLAVDKVPKLQISPAALDFALVSQGTSKSLVLSLTNLGTSVAKLVSVDIEAGPDAGAFNGVITGSVTVRPGKTRKVTATFAPNAVRSFTGFLLVKVQNPAVAWQDVIRVSMTGSSCALRGDACAAPVFAPMNFIQFLVMVIMLSVVIALLLLFIWIPGVACQVRQLLYILNHWSEGNGDPCKPI